MKKHRFTWIDGLVLGIVLLLIAGTCIKFLVLDPKSSQSEVSTFQYQLEIRGVRQFTVDALHVGDTVYDNAGKAPVGVISDITVAPATSTISYPDGTIAEVQVQDRMDVTLTVTAEGIVKENSYEVGAYDIQVNRGDTYYTKYSIWSATVTAIE